MSSSDSIERIVFGKKDGFVINTLHLRDGLEMESVSALQPSLSSDIVVNDVQCNRRLDDHLSSIAEINIRWIAELHEAALKCMTNKRRLMVSKRLSPLGERTALTFAGLLAGLTWRGAYDRLAKVRQPYMQWVTRALERLRPHVDPDVLIDEQQATPIARRLVVEMVCLLENKLILARLDNVRREHQRKRSVLLKRLVAFKRVIPKLMVLRLDLGYGKEHASASMDRIIDDWAALKAFITTNFPSYLSHVVKLEYGLQKGAHMHVLLLFNGAMVRQDVTIAKLIGEHWSKVTTGGMGVYFNCNAAPYKNRFSHCGVGVFNRLDEATVAGFQAVADYITKPDPLVTLMMPSEKRFYRAHLVLPERRRRPCSRTAAVAA
ncbi:inovirus-type Gp2 protein [Acidovorax sp. 69]|uniref:inovirus-type Gp2 protein n=1 Tax=Acidovorax sp. 69 TaxID=2035202 RepID=UPI000C2491A9|nr:inovirus-type Gp2 protein [Acidovorax sp. 69]